jgi:hypothetical protein
VQLAITVRTFTHENRLRTTRRGVKPLGLVALRQAATRSHIIRHAEA